MPLSCYNLRGGVGAPSTHPVTSCSKVQAGAIIEMVVLALERWFGLSVWVVCGDLN